MSALRTAEWPGVRAIEPAAEPDDARSETTRLACALISIAKTVRALSGLKLAEIGFQNGQDETLLALSETGKTVSSLATELEIRPSTVSKMADRLLERGLIAKAGDQRDGRRTIMTITQEGIAARETLVRLRGVLGAELASTLPDISVENLENLAGGLSARLRRLR